MRGFMVAFALVLVPALGLPGLTGRDGTADLAPEPVPGRVTPAHAATLAHTAAPRTLLASNWENGDDCLIERRSAVEGGGYDLAPGGDCDKVWPGLGGAGRWVERGNGLVALESGAGEMLLLLSAGDGLAFESIEPRQALISFSSVE